MKLSDFDNLDLKPRKLTPWYIDLPLRLICTFFLIVVLAAAAQGLSICSFGPCSHDDVDVCDPD